MLLFRRQGGKEAADPETAAAAARLKESLASLKEGNFPPAPPVPADSCQAEVAGELDECVAVLKDFTRRTILAVNGAVAAAARMEFLRELLEMLRQQSERLSATASTVEELASASTDVAARAARISQEADEAREQAEAGGRAVQALSSFVEEILQEFRQINAMVSTVGEGMKHIDEVVEVIREVAEQTNLLALNAAIEAARAGERGRGFAVVAEEVRKLAEHTKASAERIASNVASLQGAVHKAVAYITGASGKLDEGKELAAAAAATMEAIVAAAAKVNGHVQEISANVEEQAAATQEISAATEENAALAEKIRELSRQAGAAVYDLSRRLEEVRAHLRERAKCLELSEQLELYKVDHLLWKWRVYNMLLGFEDLEGKLQDYRSCRLGQWYYSGETAALRGLAPFREMEKPHMRLHSLTAEAAAAYRRGDLAQADRLLAEMESSSQEILQYLGLLQDELAGRAAG